MKWYEIAIIIYFGLMYFYGIINIIKVIKLMGFKKILNYKEFYFLLLCWIISPILALNIWYIILDTKRNKRKN